MKRVSLFAIPVAVTQVGCVVVGGYSNTGGWFLWPGGLGLLVMIILLFVFLSRRG